MPIPPTNFVDALGHHLYTCTTHSGAKKAHDWAVEQLADFFRTTHTAKTQQVIRIRGQRCGDIELSGYLTNTTDPVTLVLDLLIPHDLFGSNSQPNLNGTLFQILLVHRSDYIVDLLVFYSYRLIGKLTVFLQIQEFILCNQIWEDSSTFAGGLFLPHLIHTSV